MTIWGQLRPADHTTVQYAVLELKRRGSHSWQQLTELSTESSEGYIYTHAAIPAAGQVRLAWLDTATGVVDYSRTVGVS